MGVKLPGLGALGAYWRTVMDPVMTRGRRATGLVLDLRSSAYAAAWKPKGEVAGRTATVRVLHSRSSTAWRSARSSATSTRRRRGGSYAICSPPGPAPADPAELVEALRDLGYVVEAEAPAKPGRAWALDVVVTQIH